MEQYIITGMSCAACAARVEKAVSQVEGVTSCCVSLLTNTMGVEGSASPEEIISAVREAGYDGALKTTHKKSASDVSFEEEGLQNQEIPLLKRRLFFSVAFWLVLMYISMGHMMWDWPMPSCLGNNHIAMGILQLLLTGIIMVINQKFFISGFKSMLHGAPNMDALVAIGSMAAFGYSVFALFAMTDALMKSNDMLVMSYMHEFYFESAATILTLITLGKLLEAYSKGKTTDALKSLIELKPKTVTLWQEGEEQVVSVSQVAKGDVFVLRPGENIPVDGVVIYGSSAVDESNLTGESIPVDKTLDSPVYAGTLNQSGYLRCWATKVGEDTTLSQIIRLVKDAATTKAPIAKAADKVSGIFVPVVIGIGIVTVIVWLLAGQNVGFALARGISVLVISCPCALGLATPVAIMVGTGMGAKNGILFKTAVSLEELSRAHVVVLDKTGTITKGKPKVTDLIPGKDKNKRELLEIAYALEEKSEHPLAKAIREKGEEEGLSPKEITDFQALPGNGLKAMLNGKPAYGGNFAFIAKEFSIPEGIKEKSHLLAGEGKTPLFFSYDGEFYGMIAVADTMKDDSLPAIKEMQDMGFHIVMLTGDNEKTANAIGKKAGVDEVIAGVLPDGKEQVIRKLQQKGKVIMVGDGVNDAPALTSADIGIAIGAGADVAIDAADVVLMKNSLMDVPAAIRLSRATLRNIHENLFWAFIYNILGIPLAAGLLIPVFGWQLNPTFAAAAMSLSSFCVVTNALRLNFFSVQKGNKDFRYGNKMKNGKMEEKMMKKTMKIEGMMCGHCEMHTKNALEALEGVKEAEVSYQTGIAIVTLERNIPDDVLKQAVTEQGYEVVELQ